MKALRHKITKGIRFIKTSPSDLSLILFPDDTTINSVAFLHPEFDIDFDDYELIEVLVLEYNYQDYAPIRQNGL